MSKITLLSITLLLILTACNTTTSEMPVQQPSTPYFPEKALGELFHDVQTGGIFPDYKTFVDCNPKSNPAEIAKNYLSEKEKAGFDLKTFVLNNFELPPAIQLDAVEVKADMIHHLKTHWPYLTRTSGEASGHTTLVSLPHPFVVPGGRFREMFYWDSYFTILGLLESDENELALGMIRNFAFLIEEYGYIPNGNRTYFLSRSQPPFFAEMLRAYADKHGLDTIKEFLGPLETEYGFWVKEKSMVNAAEPVYGHSVWFEAGFLNRYYGNFDYPRPEGHGKEYRWAQALPEADRPQYHRHLRAACESGWDFSSRWFADHTTKVTTHTENIVPVCLNSLLYNAESFLADAYQFHESVDKAKTFQKAAQSRASLLQQVCWSEEQGLFLDYVFTDGKQSPVLSLATVYPLYFGLATQEQADAVAQGISSKFLHDGGVVTTLNKTGEQWDYPNGWAPLQWLTVKGLARYGHEDLAIEVADRWLNLNEKVFKSDQKMMEKYNVVDTTLAAGGGEYPNQDGFGWTNGVALALHAMLADKN
ncbi:MAG: trehalase family glycosidase [Bacteroidota bacterium]